LYVALASLVPVVIVAFISLIMILIILIARQAIIILLIVISPLAFVCFLLPNTEQLFKKWQNTFTAMLILFPVIGLVFGVSHMASTVLSTAFTPEGGDPNQLGQIVAAAVIVLPLFVVPSLLKKSLDGVGNIGATLNGLGAKMGGTLGKPAGAWADGAMERRTNRLNNDAMNNGGRFNLRKRYLQHTARRDRVNEFQKSESARAQNEYIADLAGTDSDFRGRMSSGGSAGADMRALANATNTIAELDSKEVAAASTVIGKMNLDSKDKIILASGGTVTKDGYSLSGKDSAVRRAGIRSALAVATVAEAEQVIKSSGNMSSSERRELSSSITSSGIANKATHLGGETLGKIEQGALGITEDEIDESLNNAVISNIQKGKYSADKITANEVDSLKRIRNIMNSPDAEAKLGTDEFLKMHIELTSAITDPRLSVGMGPGQKDVIAQIKDPTKP